MKRRTIDREGAVGRFLHSRYGYGSFETVAKTLAAGILTSAKQYHPPINMTAIYPVQHIISCNILQIPEDGRLVVEGNGFLLQVKAGPETRIRFTIAHEIAHTVFYDLKSPYPKLLINNANPAEEERFCNLLAAEIIMPDHMIRQELKCFAERDQFSPIGMILQLAERFKVSPDAMTRRLLEDLDILAGIAITCRWLPGTISKTQEKKSQDWRIVWWAASRHVQELLYIPAVANRPKINLEIIEDTYLKRSSSLLQVPLALIRVGNLKRILMEYSGKDQSTDLWLHPIIPNGIQLNVSGDQFTDSHIDSCLRNQSQVLLFFPVKERSGKK